MKKKFVIFIFFFSLFCIQAMWAQDIQVKGVVTGADDKLPVIGVTVQVKGTTQGTITDADGNYLLTAPSNGTLKFSFVGMKSIEVPIEGKTEINVVMEGETKAINEVIVVGYGTQIKRNLTGSIVKVDTKDINQIPVNSFESAMQGKTAGVFIEKASGKLGEAIKMRIRGSSSISADNQPIYVVDGMIITSQDMGVSTNQPTSPLADINFNDIESMQVLKDASAAAIYGSRASNGVVVITTKKGKSGKTTFNADLSYGSSTPARLKKWLDATQYRELFDESIKNVAETDGTLWGMTHDELYDYFIPGWKDGNNTDWQSLCFQKAPVMKFNVSASGGNDKTKFFFGGSYDQEKGILVNNDFKRISGRMNLEQKASESLIFGGGISITRSVMNRVANDNAFATPMQMVALCPLQAPYDKLTGKPNSNTTYYNGLFSIEGANENTGVFRNLANAFAQYNFTKKINFRSEFGFDLLDQRENSFYGRETIGAGPAGEGFSRTVQVINYSTNNFFTYDTKFADAHKIQVTAGMSFQKETAETNYLYGAGFPTDYLQTMYSAAEITSFDGTKTADTYLSYFTRLNYNLKEKYLVSVSGRMDGSSKFGKDSRYGFFPAGSIGWIVSNESFLEKSKVISFLKLRLSAGVTGNSGIGNFDHLSLYKGTLYPGMTGIQPNQLGNSDLHWEGTTQYDAGIDFGLFNDRLNGELDYYIKNTNDLLLYQPLPGTSGYSSVAKNIGKLENKGYEISINSNNLVGEFKWTTSFNYSVNKNKVLKLAGSDIVTDVNRVMEGQPIGVFVMVKYAGVDPQNGDALFYKNNTSDSTTNNFSQAKTQVCGSPNPKFSGGITNTFSYKGFDLSVNLSFVYGNKIWNTAGMYQSANADWWDNQTADQLDRWKKPGDKTDIPQARFGDSNGTQKSSRYLSDGSYLRLRNLGFGYSLPKTILTKLKIEKCRIYFSAVNLFTFTKYTGWDPEVNYTGIARTTQQNNIIQGTDFYTVPQSKTYTFGINIGF